MQTEPLDTLTLVPDSMNQVLEVVEIPQASLFEEHELTASQPLTEQVKTEKNYGAVLLGIVVCLLILAYLQRTSEGFFKFLFRAAFNRNLAIHDSRMENSQRVRGNLLVQIAAFLSVVLFVSVSVFNTTAIEMSLVEIMLRTFGILFLAYWLKRWILFGIGFIFQVPQAAKHHRLNLNLFFSISGLLLLPVTILILFAPDIPSYLLVFLGLSIISFLYLNSLLQGFSLSVSTSGIKLVHLFYYFCALEILPVFILVRFLSTL